MNDLGQIAGHLNGIGTIWTDGVPQTVFSGPVSAINNAGNWSAYTDAAAYLKYGTHLADVAYTTAMNERGEVVGHFRASPGASATLWSGGLTLRLGTLGGVESRAWDINDASQIAGQAQTAAGVWHAFLYTAAEGMVDLNGRVDAGLGWELQNARGINAAGQITGTGVIGGQNHAYLLTPLPSAGSGAFAQVDRSFADFGTVVIGASGAVKSVTLTNTGDAPLNVSSVSLVGGSPGEFSVTGGAGVMVPPGGSTSLTITFAPTATGPRSTFLAINSDSYYSPTTITLIGAGTAPSTMQVSPSSLHLLAQPPASSGVVHITNTGTVPLTLGSVSIQGPDAAAFHITSSICAGAALAPGGDCPVWIWFAPADEMESLTLDKSATLVVTDQAAGSSQAVQLFGHTQAPGASVSAQSLSFGSQLVGSTSFAQSVTITNTGDWSLGIEGFNLSGANPGDFTILNANPYLTVPPGQSVSVQVAFKPSTPGSRSAVLVINDPIIVYGTQIQAPHQVVLSGTGTASGPWVQLDASTLDFGSVTLDTTGTAQNITVTNTGGAPLHISSVDLTGANAGDFIVNGGTGATVAVGGSVVLSVAFTPGATGSRSASLMLSSDAGNSPTSVGLIGTGVAPVVIPRAVASISPAQLDFGSQPVGTSNGSQVFILQNTGNAPLTIANVALAGANPADFTVVADGWSGTQLAPGQVATLSLRFTPTATGTRSASLVVTDDAAGSPQVVPLTGTGTAPAASLSVDHLSFTEQLVGSTSPEQTVILTNTGTARLILGGVALAGDNAADFTAAMDPGTLALAPGESRTVHVRFRPTAPASRAATLLITDSAAGSPQTVALTGTGTAPSLSFGISRLSGPGTISFGSVALGTASTTQNLTLTNSGTAPLTISSLTLTGADAGDYRITADSGGTTLPPGGSRTLTLRFTPLALGSRRAALTITDNIASGPQTVALDGAGILPTSGSQGQAAIPTAVSLVIDSVDGTPVQTPSAGTNKVLVVAPGQHVTLKLRAKFANGAVADVTGDANAHLGLGATVGQFTAKNVWLARPADAGRLVTFYGRYRSLAGGRQLVGTVKLSVLANRRRK